MPSRRRKEALLDASIATYQADVNIGDIWPRHVPELSSDHLEGLLELYQVKDFDAKQ